MPRVRLPAMLLLLGLGTIAQAQQATPAKKLYCWNEGGRRICGDALPANAVDAPRVELDARSGMPTAEYGRALTPAERAAAEAARRADAEAAAAAEAEKRRWMAMAESFQSEDDLRRAFQSRIVLSQDSIKTARMGIAGLRDRLVDMLQRAGQVELAGKPVPKKLAADIQAQHAELLRQQALLVRLEGDAASIRSQLEEALVRYRESRAPRAGAQPAG